MKASKHKPEPIIRLYEAWKVADKRLRRAYKQLDEGEGTARARGAALHGIRGLTVGRQHCLSGRQIERAGSEAGFSKKRIAELVGHLREQEIEARTRREAAGLKPLDVEAKTARAEWNRALATIARTPSRSFAGLAVKLRFIAADIQDGPTREANKMARSALADALRLGKRD